MQQKIILQIPTPCHENWNNMDVSTQKLPGKFCDSCQKNVVDFTNMSDAQVLAYFSTNNNNTCGRFEGDQLNRVMATPPPPKKSWYKWIMAAMVSGFLFSNRAKAQTGSKVGELQICTVEPTSINITAQLQGRVGGVIVTRSKPVKLKYILEGAVFNENGMPLSGASVMVTGTKNGTATDVDGKFSIAYSDKNLHPQLQISYVGYEVAYKNVDLSNQINETNSLKSDVKITLKPDTLSTYAIAGLVAVVRKEKKINKVVDTLRNILPKFTAPTNDKLVVAPNPAKAGSSVSLSFNKAGEYQVQLFNLQSMVLQSQKITIVLDGAKATFNLPTFITQGEYFIAATNQQNKKCVTAKLIVQ